MADVKADVEGEAVRLRARAVAGQVQDLPSPATVQADIPRERLAMSGLSDGAVLAEALGRLRQIALSARALALRA